MPGIDHQRVGLPRRSRERLENPIEHAEFAPSQETIVERLVRTVFLRRVLPLKSMFQHVNKPLTTRRSSTRGMPWASGKYGLIRPNCDGVSKNKSLMAVPPAISESKTRKMKSALINRA
jgi:hypothetical protein